MARARPQKSRFLQLGYWALVPLRRSSCGPVTLVVQSPLPRKSRPARSRCGLREDFDRSNLRRIVYDKSVAIVSTPGKAPTLTGTTMSMIQVGTAGDGG